MSEPSPNKQPDVKESLINLFIALNNKFCKFLKKEDGSLNKKNIGLLCIIFFILFFIFVIPACQNQKNGNNIKSVQSSLCSKLDVIKLPSRDVPSKARYEVTNRNDDPVSITQCTFNRDKSSKAIRGGPLKFGESRIVCYGPSQVIEIELETNMGSCVFNW